MSDILQPEDCLPVKYEAGTILLRRRITLAAEKARKLGQLRNAIAVIEPRIVGVSYVSPEFGENEVTAVMHLRFSGDEWIDGMAIWALVDSFVPEPTDIENAEADLRLLKALLKMNNVKITNYVTNNVTNLAESKALFVKILKTLRNLIIILRVKLDE